MKGGKKMQLPQLQNEDILRNATPYLPFIISNESMPAPTTRFHRGGMLLSIKRTIAKNYICED